MICQKRNIVDGSGNKIGESIWFFCPGCEVLHQVYVQHSDPKAPVWKWDGSFAKPTFSPSILVSKDHDTHRCHSFVREGKIQFLGDCYHELKGQTVSLPKLPEWAR